jgi:acyl-CoA dehydrogenase
MIAQALDRMLEGCAASPEGFDARLWQTVAASGVHRMLRPEHEGGAGEAAWSEAVEVLQVWARHGADIPLADTVLAHRLLSLVGNDPGEELPVVLEIAGPLGEPDPTEVLPKGALRLVLSPWGETVTGVLIDAAGASQSLTWPDAPRVRAELAVGAAAVLTGAMRQNFDLTLSYAGTRVQFGRPIGQFQAVQHALALAAEEIAASRAALDWAGSDLAMPGVRPSAAIAKARSAEAAGKVAAITHQAHGAIGFTAEYALIRTSRLLWRWRDRWGDEQHWNALLGQAALAQDPQALFDLVIGEQTLSA